MDKIFNFGGFGRANQDFCLEFDTKSCRWKKIARMVHYRYCAACAVFEDRIVVCGGYGFGMQNTAESYDVLPDKWSPMPNMNSRKAGHSLVVAKNKLFVISRFTFDLIFEAFDNISKTFLSLKPPPKVSKIINATIIGNKVFVFQGKCSSLIYYDVDKNKWLEEPCELTRSLEYFSCAKVLCLK